MKNKITLSVLFSFFGLCTFAQTIVSTTPENKKVILEEFTGIYCVFCPDGHTIANAIKADNPDDFFIINVHNSGSFSEPNGNDPDFQTPDGEILRNTFNVNSFPSGLISRHTFSGGSPVQGRGSWSSSTNQLLDEASYVNVGVAGNIDMNTRELAVTVEVFYTAGSTVSSNYLTLALTQDRTLGPQTGGGSGDNYEHNHRLVDILTPTLGEEITTITAGTLVERTYTYAIPAMYNNVPAVLEDMELVAFVAETNEEIISGNGSKPTYTNVELANDVDLIEVSEIEAPCSANDITPQITFKNNGQNTISSLDINYSINGGASQLYTYTGNLTSFQFATIEIDEASYTLLENNTIVFTIADDDDINNNILSADFQEPAFGAGESILTIVTDQYANETSYVIFNSAGGSVVSGSLGGGDNNSTVVIPISLDTADCYNLELRDSYGDGIFNGGGATLEDIYGVILANLDGEFTDSTSRNFNANGVLGIGDNDLTAVSVFPNPASSKLNIANAENATVEIYNILGQVMAIKTNISSQETIDVSGYAAGAYMAKISNAGITTTKKFVVIK